MGVTAGGISAGRPFRVLRKRRCVGKSEQTDSSKIKAAVHVLLIVGVKIMKDCM